MDSGFLKTMFIGVPMLVFAIWQIISVSREIEADRRAEQASSDESADPRHSERQK